MTTTTEQNFTQLRQKAEAELARAPVTKLMPHPANELQHELDVHQIELEMQNEQLRHAMIELEISRDRYADFYDFAPVGYLTLNPDGLIDEINLTGATMLGVDRHKLPHHRFASHIDPEHRDHWHRHFLNALTYDGTLACELVLLHGDGTRFNARLDCLRLNKAGKIIGMRIMLTDITERKTAEAKALRLSQFYNALAQCNEAITHSVTEEELFNQTCCILVQVGGIKMAWVGLVDEAGKQVVPVASCGDGKEYLEGIKILIDADSPFGRGPTATAIRENKPFWCQDFMHDPCTAPWHERGARFGWRASASLPLHRKGVSIGAISLYSGVVNAFDEATRNLLGEMAKDVSYALDNIAREAERKKADSAIHQSQAELQAAQRIAHVGSWQLDVATNHVVWSEELYRMLGLNPELPPPDYNEHKKLFTPESWERLSTALPRTQETGVPYELELEMVRPDGSHGWMLARGEALRDASNAIVALHGVAADITERRMAEEMIRNMASYDLLTQLPNRRLLNDRLEQTMIASKRTGRYGALMFLDLDSFKPLNDAHGHDVGDLLLIKVACRIVSCVRETDTVARFGGDEFVVMLSELDADKTESITQASIVAEKIRAALAEPYVLIVRKKDGTETAVEHHCMSSIGVVLFINHEAGTEEIIKWADMAMYQAKEAGGNQIRFYDEKVCVAAMGKLE